MAHGKRRLGCAFWLVITVVALSIYTVWWNNRPEDHCQLARDAYTSADRSGVGAAKRERYLESAAYHAARCNN